MTDINLDELEQRLSIARDLLPHEPFVMTVAEADALIAAALERDGLTAKLAQAADMLRQYRQSSGAVQLGLKTDAFLTVLEE